MEIWCTSSNRLLVNPGIFFRRLEKDQFSVAIISMICVSVFEWALCGPVMCFLLLRIAQTPQRLSFIIVYS